jgi:hypothetical protein
VHFVSKKWFVFQTLQFETAAGIRPRARATLLEMADSGAEGPKSAVDVQIQLAAARVHAISIASVDTAAHCSGDDAR